MKLKKLTERMSSKERRERGKLFLDLYQSETVPKYTQENMPFFILGAPRSGTTLLRNLLRDHPRLECPEETHFFRWSDPFSSPKFIAHYKTKLFKKHRKMDKIKEMPFAFIMDAACSREHIAYEYGKKYLKNIGAPSSRLYDKTPQNVYGIFLINATYPEAKFIHIYRNPLNVVASLMEGKVMPKHSLRGAINSWVESMMLISQFKQFRPELLLEVCYEDLTKSPDAQLKKILTFINEDVSLLPSQKSKTHPEKNKYLKKLKPQEIEIIFKQCNPYLSKYGYENLIKSYKTPIRTLNRILKRTKK